MKVELDNKRVFISAGADGMGRSTVLSMLDIGAKVFTCDINQKMLNSLPAEITSYHCDVSNPEDVDAMFDDFIDNGLDVLVNNAGIGGPTKPIEEVTNDEWRQTMSVGIDSQFYCCRRAVPVFRDQQQGVIINMVSAAGILGYPNRSPYVAAKWAVSGLTKTLAMELGPDNIRVNGIVPGNVNGDRLDRVVEAHAKAEGLETDAVRHLYAISTSMQCFIDPKEISNLICFLCSDLGKHISGQIIGVDGYTETLYPRS
ncbi:MAG: NAD(P)-dependent dehydrogenase (short-subunit alcohol dehydrogenase family) [Arenicella sp.]|jgi:NAD(P)-dependent dehydrogenase (short-subunit alcohol dehydrogenase family)